MGCASGQLVGQLEPLRFPSGQRVGALPKLQIADAKIAQRLQRSRNPGVALEVLHGFVSGHVQDLADVTTSVANFQRGWLKAGPTAHFTGRHHVGQKRHLADDGTLALAGGTATSALGVKREALRCKAGHFGFGQARVQTANLIPHAQESGWYRARRTANRRLIHRERATHMLAAVQLRELQGSLRLQAQSLPQRRIKDFLNERTFPRAANPRDYTQSTHRHSKID